MTLNSSKQHSIFSFCPGHSGGTLKAVGTGEDKSVRGVRYLGAGGIESLVAGCSHWHLKMGAGFAVMPGNKDGGGKRQRMQIPKEVACPPFCFTWNNTYLWHPLHKSSTPHLLPTKQQLPTGPADDSEDYLLAQFAIFQTPVPSYHWQQITCTRFCRPQT